MSVCFGFVPKKEHAEFLHSTKRVHENYVKFALWDVRVGL